MYFTAMAILTFAARVALPLLTLVIIPTIIATFFTDV